MRSIVVSRTLERETSEDASRSTTVGTIKATTAATIATATRITTTATTTSAKIIVTLPVAWKAREWGANSVVRLSEVPVLRPRPEMVEWGHREDRNRRRATG
jgi:hypothetical protein